MKNAPHPTSDPVGFPDLRTQDEFARGVTDRQPSQFGPVSGQQLVARIKRSSKYWGQTAPNQWFDVRVVEDRLYHLRGNNNNYRLSDVVLGVRLPGSVIVILSTGRSLTDPTRAARKGASHDSCLSG